MSIAENIRVAPADPCVAAAAREVMEATMRESEKASMCETAGIDAAEFFADKYWERRCQRAERELQKISQELERVRDSLEEKLTVITCLERDNLMLSVQLDMVHLIFGHK